MSELTDELISTLIEHAEAFPGPHCEVPSARWVVPSAGSTRRHRVLGAQRGFVFIGLAHWLERHEEEAQLAWVQGLSDAVRPNSVGTSVNFLGDEGEERIRFAYGSGEKYDRLVELKRAWDPQNLFRLNQNIRP